ncbi:MAG TPA: hypothetical protein VJN93_07550 [Candidatus Acidoferrum sp.]|nr:hypothetical protein [Candidatus Acidoferrum sp.]
MKRILLTAAAAGLCLFFGATARSQMGMNFLNRPAISDFFRPVVGGGAVYQTVDPNSPRNGQSMEMLVVGKEMVGAKEGYWLEFSFEEKAANGKIYSKVLVSTEDFQPHRIVFQMPGGPAMEMPAQMGSRTSQKIADDLANWTKVGTESLTVPAGTFACQHWKKKDGKGDVWVNDSISPFGMVKEISNGSSEVLVKILTGEKDHITGPVSPFNPQLFQQMMMNQAGKERQ